MLKAFTVISNRRTAPRLPMRVPVTILSQPEGDIYSFSSDLSVCGVYLHASLKRVPEVDSNIDLLVTFPPELTMSKSLTVNCQARVVRIDHSDTDEIGIAAEFHHYEFVPCAHL